MGWERQQVARWIWWRSEPLVIGWPFNGTRRWYRVHQWENPHADDYVGTVIRVQAEKQRMLFELGASTILAPCFGYVLLSRGEQYTRTVLSALLRLEDNPIYRQMFEAGVRLRFYGDFEEALDTPTLRPMLRACHNLMARTDHNDGPLLLLGLFADSPHERIARMGIDFWQRRGRAPSRQELIQEYYGAAVPNLSLYIGFARPALFDVPLITTGDEDLYATLSPSPEVTEAQLRDILYDHLVMRRIEDTDYGSFSAKAVERLKEYNEACREQTVGVGRLDPLTGLWKPTAGNLTTDTW